MKRMRRSAAIGALASLGALTGGGSCGGELQLVTARASRPSIL